MACRLVALTWDALDPVRLARFWGTLLRWPLAGGDHGSVEVRPTDDTGSSLGVQADVSGVVLADPDGNEFCVLEPR